MLLCVHTFTKRRNRVGCLCIGAQTKKCRIVFLFYLNACRLFIININAGFPIDGLIKSSIHYKKIFKKNLMAVMQAV
jgi:hypothetical protein